MSDARVIVVTGPPASGKSSLSRELAERLSVPLLSKDELKERLYETIGSGAELERQIERAALAIVFSVAGTQLDAGVPVILESDFQRPRDEEPLRDLARDHRAGVVQVHCKRDADELVDHFVERVLEGRRHPGHGDEPADAAEVRAKLDSGVWDPLDLGGETIEVDTHDDSFAVDVLAGRLREG